MTWFEKELKRVEAQIKAMETEGVLQHIQHFIWWKNLGEQRNNMPLSEQFLLTEAMARDFNYLDLCEYRNDLRYDLKDIKKRKQEALKAR